MMFRTHIIFALFFYLLFVKIFSFNFSWLFALMVCLGSVLPDLDSPSSFINKRYLFGIGKVISTFSSHRGFWHSVFGATIFFLVSLAINLAIKLPFIFALPLGYILHLAADSLNVSGIKWFWKSGYIKGPIRTASLFEQFLFIALIAGTVYVIIGKQGIEKITSFFANKFK